MEKALENLIESYKNGLYLMDPPTGFGKTTAVVKMMKRFLNGDPIFHHVKRLFFITNLNTNLPFNDLWDQLTDEEKKHCFRARATIDYILDKITTVDISDMGIAGSAEYNNLKKEVESYNYLKDKLANATKSERIYIRKNLLITKQKISEDTEPKFRNLIKSKLFANKSVVEKRQNIKNNPWIKLLYPICDLSKFKVVFMTTKKFLLPLDTFERIPYYAYCDDITKDSILFFDEFDSTKQTILDQIISDGLKNKIDSVALFLNIHLALQNFTIPTKLMNMSKFHLKKIEEDEWYTNEERYDHWGKKFSEIYDKYNFKYIIKSDGFKKDKAFLFDDGSYFNVVQDSSNKFIYVSVDEEENVLALKAKKYDPDGLPINTIIKDIEYCIDGFTKALRDVADNFMHYKNEAKSASETRYTFEEALYSVIDVLNLSDYEKNYMFNKIQQYDFTSKIKDVENKRRGFSFTEIEDSNYHDAKSVVHGYYFNATPEDVIIGLANKSLVVGISATANVATCIGNFDLNYLRKNLGSKFIENNVEDERRIDKEFSAIQNKFKGKYNINVSVIDNITALTDRERCEYYINKLFDKDKAVDYLKILEDKKTNAYYYNLELKLAFLYKEALEKDIHSFIAFCNRLPRKNDKNVDILRIEKMIENSLGCVDKKPIDIRVVESANFEDEFSEIKLNLENGGKEFVITTYQTIGSGKNIQYKIPESLRDRVVIDPEDTRGTKDFEAIYLSSPTNLVRYLAADSENKHVDLANYLFQQEYLYKQGMPYYQLKHNITAAFKRIFFGEQVSFYGNTQDINLHTLKTAIQATGRICRSRNKNKEIYIFSDRALVERIQNACEHNKPKLLNEEFSALLGSDCRNNDILIDIEKYSIQNKNAYKIITFKSYRLRSIEAIAEWKDLRDYVLKNPTVEEPKEEYKDYYFKFAQPYNKYYYKMNYKGDITALNTYETNDMSQISEQDCDLPAILAYDFLNNFFKEKGYARKFEKNRYIMSQSLYKQVYLGALGEVVCQHILETELNIKLEDLDDIEHYESFDYKIGNIYFDMKNWKNFNKNNDEYVNKLVNKLRKIRGSKCIVINLFKRSKEQEKINIGENVIQIPYLIDPLTETINREALSIIYKSINGI